MSRTCCLLTILAATLLGSGAARADEGLKLPGNAGWSAWPSTLRFQATLVEPLPRSLATLAPQGAGDRASGATLIGDYYLFGAPEDTSLNWASGLRASGGLLVRSPGLTLNDLARSSRAGAAGAPSLHLPPGATFGYGLEPTTEGIGTLPYLGLGYSSQASRSGWGFWADVGLVVQNPSGALGLGRTLSGSQGADDLIRELRLSPMLQLGINYSF